ncbi:MAG: DUF445 domain-containing protein [Bacillota bacterium]
MSIWQMILIPLISALIGWLTNLIAVILLFRPYRPVVLLGYTLQGLIPRRHAELARSVGQVVEQELLSAQDVFSLLTNPDFVGEISTALAQAIRQRVLEKLPPFIPLSIKNIISDVLSEQAQKELPLLLGQIGDQIRQQTLANFQVSRLVEEKILAFPLERLEKLIVSVAGRELRHIEILGGVLGFIIGLVQLVIINWTSWF